MHHVLRSCSAGCRLPGFPVEERGDRGAEVRFRRVPELHDQRMSFEGDSLRAALMATFDRRQTALPVELPIALTDEFALDTQKQNQWRAFSDRLREPISAELGDVVAALREFLWPAVAAADTDTEWRARWSPGGPWS